MAGIEGLGVAGVSPAFEHSEHNVPSGLDEMMLETITPARRANTLDPEVRNPPFKGGEGSYTSTWNSAPPIASTPLPEPSSHM
ncbi:MAG: hypothetical protein ACO2OZ_02345 [Acidilobaceae archaeon]